MLKIDKKTTLHDPLLENFNSLEELEKFWDTQITADYENLMEDVDIKKRKNIPKI